MKWFPVSSWFNHTSTEMNFEVTNHVPIWIHVSQIHPNRKRPPINASQGSDMEKTFHLTCCIRTLFAVFPSTHNFRFHKQFSSTDDGETIIENISIWVYQEKGTQNPLMISGSLPSLTSPASSFIVRHLFHVSGWFFLWTLSKTSQENDYWHPREMKCQAEMKVLLETADAMSHCGRIVWIFGKLNTPRRCFSSVADYVLMRSGGGRPSDFNFNGCIQIRP